MASSAGRRRAEQHRVIVAPILDKYLNGVREDGRLPVAQDRLEGPCSHHSIGGYDYKRKIQTNAIKINIERNESDKVEGSFHTFHTLIVSVKGAPYTCGRAVKPLSTGPALWIRPVLCRRRFLP